MKGAFFIHGWATGKRIWHRYWHPDMNMPLVDMFEENGYRTQVLEMPGAYLHKGKDFKWYSNYLGHVIRERTDLDEIILICHSMGGIVGREYIANSSEIFSEGRDRIAKIIMLGTPNHGTNVLPFDGLSEMIAKMADMVILREEGMKEEKDSDHFLNTPCYRDIRLGSTYLEDLNKKTIHSHVEQHVIWTNGDAVMQPQHTCVLEGARNHLIDRISVNHFNMCYTGEVIEEVERIILDKDDPQGLQEYPDREGCGKIDEHIWLPSSGMVNRVSHNIWECANCNLKQYSHALPLGLICDKERTKPKLHRWYRKGKFHRYRFKCQKCNAEIWFPALPSVPE